MQDPSSRGLYRVIVFAVAAASWADPAAFAEEAQPSPLVAAAMRPYLDSRTLPGLVAIIAERDGTVRFKNQLGFADVEQEAPISDMNVFWVASMTKMFAGAAVVMLADEGKLSLDDPVDKYFPRQAPTMGVRSPGGDTLVPLLRAVTVRHLLSHTHGLDGELKGPGRGDGAPLRERAEAYLAQSKWHPGEQYQYGNKGMNVAARIVEIVSGVSYDQFLQRRFFDPLGMTETTFWPTRPMVDRLAGAYGPSRDGQAYQRGEIGFLTEPLWDRAGRFPEAGGGLFSTAHDMLLYGVMLANDGDVEGHRYLSPEAMNELRRQQTGATRVNYSLGYHLRNGMFGHDGALGTDLSVDPSTGMITVFLTQSTSADKWEARDVFLRTARDAFQSER